MGKRRKKDRIKRNLTRSEITEMVDCPRCGAQKGSVCVWPYPKSPAGTSHYERMSLAHQGMTGRIKISNTTKSTSRQFYKSWEWKRLRYEALRIAIHRCMCCGWAPGDTERGRLVVDHIQPISRRPDLALEINNLQVLCNDCNMGKSNVFSDDFRDIDQWLKSIAVDG